MNANRFIRLATQAAKTSTHSPSFDELADHTGISGPTLSRWATGKHTDQIASFLNMLALLPLDEVIQLFQQNFYEPNAAIFQDCTVSEAETYLLCTLIGCNPHESITHVLKTAQSHPPLSEACKQFLEVWEESWPLSSLREVFCEPFASQLYYSVKTGRPAEAFLSAANEIADKLSSKPSVLLPQDRIDIEALQILESTRTCYIDLPTTLGILKDLSDSHRAQKWDAALKSLKQGEPWVEKTPLSPAAKLWLSIDPCREKLHKKAFSTYLRAKNLEAKNR
jgi:hypothetical protein